MAAAGSVGAYRAGAASLLNEPAGYSGGVVHLQAVADIGSDSLISITHRPDRSDLYVTTQTGQVYEVDAAGNASVWFDYNQSVAVAKPNAYDSFKLTTTDANHGGLRSVAFHPDFENNGLFYTSAAVVYPGNTYGLNYIGTSQTSEQSDSAVAEWRYDFGSGQVDPNSYRELFRVNMPVYDHPIKQMAFNPYATPGDEDYGLLYITHGDGSVQSAIAGGGLVPDDALGKVLRINPLKQGDAPYTTPNNPFVGDPGTLDEIYTLGHRNPHNLSFALDGEGNSRVIVAEIGRDNIEEINILQKGANFGWSDREGTFIHLEDGGFINGVAELPDDEWALNDYVYPAVQYDHDAEPGAGYVGSAVAGGFVLDHPDYEAIANQYLFADFGTFSGNLYHADWSEMLAAHTQLADYQLPSELSQAQMYRLILTLDDDGDGQTDRAADNLNAVFGVARNDVRFGRGPDGRMYLTSKKTGKLYVVAGASTNFGKAPGMQLRLDESFEYEDGALSNNDHAMAFWAGPWIGGHEVVQGAVVSEEDALASRAFVGHEPGQTVYFSFQLTAPQETAVADTAWLQIDDNAYDDSNDGVQIGVDDGMLSVRINGPENRGDFGTYTPGQAMLIVGKLVFDAEGTKEQVTAWFNPTDYETAANSATILADAGFSLVQSVELRRYGFGSERVVFDNLRVGTAWFDVVDSGAGGLPGDTDGDGDIDDADLGTVFANYTGPLASGAGDKTAADGDTDADGDVDDADLGKLFSGFTGPAALASVPEPTSAAMHALAGWIAARRRR
jgi:glucose/arabinose dehydrogenase